MARRKFAIRNSQFAIDFAPARRALGKQTLAGSKISHELVRLLAEKFPDARFAILGDDEDKPLGEIISRAAPEHCLNLCGETSLPEMVEWIRLCDLMVTNDTGPMHVAAALGKPLVALFGPTEPRRTGPYGQLENVLRIELPCSPCMKSFCTWKNPIECLTAISPQIVFERVQNAIAFARLKFLGVFVSWWFNSRHEIHRHFILPRHSRCSKSFAQDVVTPTSSRRTFQRQRFLRLDVLHARQYRRRMKTWSITNGLLHCTGKPDRLHAHGKKLRRLHIHRRMAFPRNDPATTPACSCRSTQIARQRSGRNSIECQGMHDHQGDFWFWGGADRAKAEKQWPQQWHQDAPAVRRKILPANGTPLKSFAKPTPWKSSSTARP